MRTFKEMVVLNEIPPFVDRRSRRRPETLICFSHLRWNFVYQRPQHLMARFAASRHVLYIEEPVNTMAEPHFERAIDVSGVEVLTPHIGKGVDHDTTLRQLLDQMIEQRAFSKYGLWYYTPMALPWTNHLSPIAVVYDCMDELTMFKGAPKELGERERELFKKADVVFMGGQSLFEAKRNEHPNAYVFPSSIDFSHFAKGRSACADPPNQQHIPHPRLGYAGVIDERMNLDLLAKSAEARPDWHFVIVGPVVKIDEGLLPRRENIHYLGMQSYEDLPSYLGNWDVALLPFAHNDSTRFVSPTKTPEYLAAGLPVVSTSIRDVVRPYGDEGLVHIADEPGDFIASIEKALEENRETQLAKVDALLARNSWARTWGRMNELLEDACRRRAVTKSGTRYRSPTISALPSSGSTRGKFVPSKQEAS